MRLKGILDFSLGNFLCLRGFAPMGVLQDISAPDESIQRLPKDERLKEIRDYLKKGEFLFFPEVILCVDMHKLDPDNQRPAAFIINDVNKLWESVQQGHPVRGLRFTNGIRLSTVVNQSRKPDDLRAVQYFQTAVLTFNENGSKIFSRIDGNHRLAASEDTQVRNRITPYCIIFCRNTTEFRRFSRALFHNINYKQVPLLKEHNLRLILDDTDLFPDDDLKKDPSFGWQHYQARVLNRRLDLDMVPNLRPLIESELRSFLVEQFSYLHNCGIMNDNENSVKRFKTAMVDANAMFNTWPTLKESRNRGFLAALLYYLLTSKASASAFARWVTENHLHRIESSSMPDLIEIFNSVRESRKRTIFVSMPFGKPKTEDHFATIKRVVEDINNVLDVHPPLKVVRVDLFHNGTSFEIEDKILEMIGDSGYLIADLTYCNVNVYHEVGFVMGKANAAGKDGAGMLLFLDESVSDDDKFVGFNLRGIKQIRFTSSETEFAPRLRENIERYYNLTTSQ
jgi:hypothetical protein